MSETDKAVATPLGISAYLVILIILAFVVLAWLGVTKGLREYNQQVIESARSAQWVGEKAVLAKPVKIKVANSADVCIKVASVHVNQTNTNQDNWVFDKDLIIFAERVCGHRGDYAEVHWKALSSDNTVLQSGYTNWQVDNASVKQKAEYDTSYSPDPRVAKIVVWTSNPFE